MKINFFNTLFIFLLFTPTFGVAFGGIIINLGAFIISLLYILKVNKPQGYAVLPIVTIVYFLLGILLFISSISDFNNGIFAVSSIFSVLRPFFILSMITASFLYWEKRASSMESWNSFIDTIFIFLSVCLFLELFFPEFSSFFDFFYGSRNSTLSGPLGTSYYLGYFSFFFSVHFLFLLKNRFTKLCLSKLLISVVMVFLCGSKPPLILFFFIAPVFFFPRRRLLVHLIIYSGLVIAVLLTVQVDVIVGFLSGLNVQSYNISSLIRILDNAEGAGTYSVRQEQIDVALLNSSNNYGFGSGLGRELLLESWISYYGYRYGLIGLVVYVILWFYFAVRALFLGTLCLERMPQWYVMVYLSLWYLFQPVLLLSGGMNESGITGIFSSIVFGFSIFLIKRKVAVTY